MRSALWCALLCSIATGAAAQEKEVTFEEPAPVTVSGFAVGLTDYDRVTRSNTFAAGKSGLSLFKPVGDAYLFAQLTTALEDGASSTEIDNLLASWTPHTANKWSLAFGRFDAPIGFERDDEPLNLIPTKSFSFTYARPGKLTGVQVHYTASPRVDVWGVVANGWDVTVDNNRGKTGLARIQVIPIPWVTLGFTGVYGPERDSSDANQRSLFSSDLTIDRGRLIVGAEANFGRDQQSGGNPSWRAAAVTAFLKMSRQVGLTARYDQMEDTHGLLTGTPQILRSVTLGPMWYFSTAPKASSATSSTHDSTSPRSRCAPPSARTGRPRRSSPVPRARCRARTPRVCSSWSTCFRGGRGHHAVRLATLGRPRQMARNRTARHVGAILRVRGGNGRAVRWVHAPERGGDICRCRDVHADAAGDHDGRAASDVDGRLRRTRGPHRRHQVADPGHSRARPDVRTHRGRPGRRGRRALVAATLGARPDRPPVCGALARLRRDVAHQTRFAAFRDRDHRRWVGDGRRLSHRRGVGYPPDVVVTRKRLTDELPDSRGGDRRDAPHHSYRRAGQAFGRRAGALAGGRCVCRP